MNHSAKRKLLTYTVIAYVWSFSFWIAGIAIAHYYTLELPLNEALVFKLLNGEIIVQQTLPIILSLLAVYGPMLGVVSLSLAHTEIRNSVKQRFNFDFKLRYLLEILAVLFLISVLPTVLGSLFIPGLSINTGITWDTAVITFVCLIIFQFLTSGLEEIGWRGFLLPELLKEHSAWEASVRTGLVWAFWHTPIVIFIFYSQGMTTLPQIIGSFIGFTVSQVGMACFHSYYYIKTRSFAFSIVLHALFNAIPMYLTIIFTNGAYIGIVTQLLLWVTIFVFERRHKGFFEQKHI